MRKSSAEVATFMSTQLSSDTHGSSPALQVRQRLGVVVVRQELDDRVTFGDILASVHDDVLVPPAGRGPAYLVGVLRIVLPVEGPALLVASRGRRCRHLSANGEPAARGPHQERLAVGSQADVVRLGNVVLPEVPVGADVEEDDAGVGGAGRELAEQGVGPHRLGLHGGTARVPGANSSPPPRTRAAASEPAASEAEAPLRLPSCRPRDDSLFDFRDVWDIFRTRPASRICQGKPWQPLHQPCVTYQACMTGSQTMTKLPGEVGPVQKLQGEREASA